MAVRIIDSGVLVHRSLASHQRLDPAMHEGTHKPRTGETPLLQRLDGHRQILHLNFEACLPTMLPFMKDTGSRSVNNGALTATFLM